MTFLCSHDVIREATSTVLCSAGGLPQCSSPATGQQGTSAMLAAFPGSVLGVSFTAGMTCSKKPCGTTLWKHVETKLCYPMFFWQPSASTVNAEPGIEAVVEAVVDYREWLEDKVSPALWPLLKVLGWEVPCSRKKLHHRGRYYPPHTHPPPPPPPNNTDLGLLFFFFFFFFLWNKGI